MICKHDLVNCASFQCFVLFCFVIHQTETFYFLKIWEESGSLINAATAINQSRLQPTNTKSFADLLMVIVNACAKIIRQTADNSTCGPKCCFFSIYILYFRFLWQAHYVKISERKKKCFCATQNCLLVTRMLHCEISLLQKALVVAEQQALHSRLSQTQEACDHLKEQLEALRRNSLSLQDSCTSLQTLNTQLQVTA